MEEIKRETIKLYKGAVEIEFLKGSHIYYLIKDGKKLPKKKRLIGTTTFTGQIDKSSQLIIWATKLYTKTVLKLMGDGKNFTLMDIGTMLAVGQDAHKKKKEEAATIGDCVHKFAEEYSKDKNPKEAYDRMEKELGKPANSIIKQVQTGCIGFVDWLEKEKIKILSAEQIVYSRKTGAVGTYDAIVKKVGKRYLTDYKTSKAVYSSFFYQSSNYFKSYEEEHPKDKLDGVMIVSIPKEDIIDREGNITKKAGSVSCVIRTRAEVLKDYVAFESLVVLKTREKEVAKQLGNKYYK